MLTRAELKRQAKNQLKGNLAVLIVTYIIYSAVMGFITILAIPMEYSVYNMYFKLAYNNTDPDFGDLVDGYKDLGTSIKFFGLHFVMAIYILLWSMLFVIPGLVKSYSYSAAPYIMLLNPDKGINECITESRKLMDGRKMNKFILDLSFIPNILLVVITFGIYAFYLIPYQQATFANFYTENVLVKPAKPKTYDDNNDTFDDSPTYTRETTQTTTEHDDFDFKKPKEESNEFSDLVGSIKDEFEDSK